MDIEEVNMEQVVIVAEEDKLQDDEVQDESKDEGEEMPEGEPQEEREEPIMMPTDDNVTYEGQKMFRRRNPWPESKIAKLLDGYISEYLTYMRARKDRQIREFHTYIGQMVGVSGNNAANLVKNLGREYRKLKQQNHNGGLDGTLKLRGSVELFNKYEHYCLMYNPMSGGERNTFARKIMSMGGAGTTTKQPSDSLIHLQTPRVKKRRQTLPSQLPYPVSPTWNNSPQKQSSSPDMPKVPTVMMSDKHSAEYIGAIREQTQVLTDIAKELRLLRMGYFTEHDLSMEA